MTGAIISSHVMLQLTPVEWSDDFVCNRNLVGNLSPPFGFKKRKRNAAHVIEQICASLDVDPCHEKELMSIVRPGQAHAR